MNTPHTPDAPAGPAARAALPAVPLLSASERLALSRAQLAGWFDHDRETRSAAPDFDLTALAILPWVSRWRSHPLAALVLGAVARAWQHKAPDGATPALQVLVLGTAVSVLRRHPKTVLVSVAFAAVTLFWVRWRQRGRSSSLNP